MHIKFNWIMERHFKHLHIEMFPMVSWLPNLVVVFLFNQGFEHLGLPHECNSQCGSALGNHWAPSLAHSPICESVFHSWTHSLGLMGLCNPHVVANWMLSLWHLWYPFSMFHLEAFLFVTLFPPFWAFGINLQFFIQPLWGFLGNC
jgi:hypothetical protein